MPVEYRRISARKAWADYDAYNQKSDTELSERKTIIASIEQAEKN
jgi:hypothetical protein